MKRDQTEEGKLSQHSVGLGTITEEMVRNRAREIALTNGRDGSRVQPSDEEQARRELQGQERLYPSPTKAENLPESTRWNPSPGSAGRKSEVTPVPDEQTVAEKLVEEGVAEAEHDRQVEAVRAERQREDLG